MRSLNDFTKQPCDDVISHLRELETQKRTTMMNHRNSVTWASKGLLIVWLSLAISGCGKSAVEGVGKAPRPVTTMTLVKSKPTMSFAASGSVKSWKTEDIGFEVAGRVLWVLEPGKNINGRVVDPDGNLVREGTPLAQVDPVRFKIAVESAEADLEVAKLSKENIEIRLTDSLPAEIKSAELDFKVANDEFGRMKKLNLQNAASQSEYDQAENLVQIRQTAISSLEASAKQAGADLRSAEAQIKRAEQALRDAERDLANTTLYASFQGQISEVMVVPGSVVSAGSPVLRLQMTNPIKVEVELSATQSRELRQRRDLPTRFLLPDGTPRETNGLVYNIDASADPATRTFTMTMLLLNETFRDELPDAMSEETVARSEDAWPLQLNRMMGTSDDVTLVEELSIRHDDQGPFVYIVTNAKLRQLFPKLLKVRKQRIVENDLRIPFLGNWIFRSVSFTDASGAPEAPNLESLYVGRFGSGDGPPANWDGESVVLDAGSQWMLRPGDLVSVDLSSDDVDVGFYVPIEAVDEDSGNASLFVVDGDKVRRLPVQMQERDNLDTGSLVEVSSPELVDGLQIVLRGVHFLRDGESVRVMRDSVTASVPISTSAIEEVQ